MRLLSGDYGSDSSGMRLAAQKSFYIERLREFGPGSARSVGWFDYLQVLLFEKLFRIISGGIYPHEKRTLLDVGCGTGDMCHYLSLFGFLYVDYSGIDILPEMITAARGKYPGKTFKRADFFSSSFKENYDYIFCSGALNLRTEKSFDEHALFVMRFIKKMYDLSAMGCGINLLAADGRDYFPKDNMFYYADRAEIMDFCGSISGKVRMDYNEYEYVFTVTLEK